MKKFGTSQPITRLEDSRFLTGTGRYVDDITPEGALHAYVLRSPVAHGVITELDVADARQADGVRAVYTAADLAAQGLKNGMDFDTVKNRDGSEGAAPARPILAEGRVRFVGEPVAVVVAETLAQARDASEMIAFDFDELDPHLGLTPGGPELHAEAPENLAYDFVMGDEAGVEAALATAAHRVKLTVPDNRVMIASMEPRGCYAELADGKLHVAFGGQGVWALKTELAGWFGQSEDAFRVTNPDVGGGFGLKGFNFPEYLVVALAARDLETPVRWMSDRSEAMLADIGGRDLTSEAEFGLDANLRITAYRVVTHSNLGAYNSGFGQAIQSELFSKVLTGAYDISKAFMNTRGVYTNTAPVDAYRGAGRPEAIYVLERLMDHAARTLDVDPMELRRRNFVTPEQMPYRSAMGELYDTGAFADLQAKAAKHADIGGFVTRREASEAAGRLRGFGVCYYIESILGSPKETARITLTGGRAKVFVGTQSTGQGHETVFAQMVHDRLGVPIEAVDVVQGDSDQIAVGGGTGGSRSVTVQGTAIKATSEAMIAGFVPFVETMLETDNVSFDADEGVFRSPGSNTVVTMLEAAEAAEAAGQATLCTAQERIKLPGRSYPNGCHICELEIDRETGAIHIDRYTVTDDFGNLMNPRLAEGQVHGGVVQGIGQAISEHVVFDETGQLLTASFMDYGMPRADDAPFIAFHSEPVPSTANDLGMKGCGEAGTVGALAAVANAVQDAVWPLGIRQADMPFTPIRVWQMLQQAEKSVAAE